MASKLIRHVFTTIKTLLLNNKLQYEKVNMLFLLWNFANLQCMFGTGPKPNIQSLLSQVQFDENDELYMITTGIITRGLILFSKKAYESYSVLTDRLYSNGMEARLFGESIKLIEILFEYSTKAIEVCNKLLIMKPVFSSQLKFTMMYFILHLPLLVFQHGQSYPKTIAIKIDEALKAIAEVILHYVKPFVAKYNTIGYIEMAKQETTAEFEIILECGEVATILLKTNISISPMCRSSLTEFTCALHKVCECRFKTFNKVYICEKSDMFSLYHTTLLHGLFELNFLNKNRYKYNIVR